MYFLAFTEIVEVLDLNSIYLNVMFPYLIVFLFV